MKKGKIFGLLTAAIFSVSFLTANNSEKLSEAHAADEWDRVSTRALAASSTFVEVEAYTFIQLSTSDYSAMPVEPGYAQAHSTTLTNFSYDDYNFKSKIYFSEDKETFVPYSQLSNDFNFLFQDGSFRLGFNNNSYTFKQCANFKYIRIDEGCEFPSYVYCNGGLTKTKYVQSETTLSVLSNSTLSPDGSIGVQSYKEYRDSAILDYTSVVSDEWNNAFFDTTPGYRHVILTFGTFGNDFFTDNQQPDATQRVTENYEIARNLKINGIPFYKIYQKYPKSQLDYAHGNNFMHLTYPEELTYSTPDYLIPEISVDQVTEFCDKKVSPFKINLYMGKWRESRNSMKVENPVKISSYSNYSWPFKFTTADPYGLTCNMPLDGCEIAFTFNMGDDNTNACNFIFYNFCISFNPAAGLIQFLDTLHGYSEVITYYNYFLQTNTDYILEMKAEIIGTQTAYKVAIDHAVFFDGVLNMDNSSLQNGGEIWTINPGISWTFSDYVELPTYAPTITFEGSSSYDFMEGDLEYNFAPMAGVVNLYSDEKVTPVLTYDEGAITNGKYNAGNWKLTISANVPNYGVVSKVILINVHGEISYANISFDNSEPIQVMVGSCLNKPANPTKASDENYDYVFDGWYFEGSKWDFDTDIVQGDMNLESRFVTTTRHYNVVVKFEGIEKLTETYRVNKGSNLSFALFNEQYIDSFTVYQNGVEITSLIVTEDTELTVVYHVVFEYHEAIPSTCFEEGTVAYYTSPLYPGYYFADASGKILIRESELHTPLLDHNLVHLEASESTCLKPGNIDCYYCPNCGRHYSDAAGEHEIDYSEWFIPKEPHILTHHEAQEDTCTHDGNIEYWTCENEPGVYYINEECTETAFDVVIVCQGHHYTDISYRWTYKDGNYTCVAFAICVGCGDLIMESVVATSLVVREATCDKEGEICYVARFTNKIFDSQTKVEKIAKLQHSFIFVEGYAATETETGLKDYYVCEGCGCYFLKDGESYVEVTYTDLIIPKIATKKGCGGSLITSSLVLNCTIGVCLILLSLKKKEEK